MATGNLQNLEDKIDRLIALSEQLQADNRSLLDREGALLRERSKLVERNEQARFRVEAMISRLKTLEIDS